MNSNRLTYDNGINRREALKTLRNITYQINQKEIIDIIQNKDFFQALKTANSITPFKKKKLVGLIEDFFVSIIGEENKKNLIAELYQTKFSNLELIEQMDEALKKYQIQKGTTFWFPLQDDGSGYQVMIRGTPNNLFDGVNISALPNSLDNALEQMNPILYKQLKRDKDMDDLLTGEDTRIDLEGKKY